MGIMTYNRLEYDLLELFCHLSECDTQTGIRIWKTVDFRHQRDMLKSLAKLKLEGQSIYGEFGRIMGGVAEANKTRNKLAHWSWLKDQNGNLTWHNIDNRSSFKEQQLKPTHADLVNQVNHIGATRREVLALNPKVQASVLTWRQTQA